MVCIVLDLLHCGWLCFGSGMIYAVTVVWCSDSRCVVLWHCLWEYGIVLVVTCGVCGCVIVAIDNYICDHASWWGVYIGDLVWCGHWDGAD